MTCTTCHSKTQNLQSFIEQADVLVTATGKPESINEKWIKNNSIVLDCGFSARNGKIQGDIKSDLIQDRVKFINPVPKGIGKLTTLFFIENFLKMNQFN